jgi:vacuolar-type H+-ATPase subunit I/STV1
MVWAREVAGWLLVLIGLGMFLVVYEWCQAIPPRMFDAAILAVPGIFVFRGGIHLLKVAIAARICQQAYQEQPAKRP